MGGIFFGLLFGLIGAGVAGVGGGIVGLISGGLIGNWGYISRSVKGVTTPVNKIAQAVDGRGGKFIYEKQSSPNITEASIEEKLTQLKQLFEKELITEEEYAKKKSDVLDGVITLESPILVSFPEAQTPTLPADTGKASLGFWGLIGKLLKYSIVAILSLIITLIIFVGDDKKEGQPTTQPPAEKVGHKNGK